MKKDKEKKEEGEDKEERKKKKRKTKKNKRKKEKKNQKIKKNGRSCPWCNGYRCRKRDTATRVQILDETDDISHSTNTLGKSMNPKYSLSSFG